MFVLCLFYFFSLFFVIFYLSAKTGQRTMAIVGEKDSPYLERIEARFQQDLLRGLGVMGILYSPNWTYSAGQPRVGPCPGSAPNFYLKFFFCVAVELPMNIIVVFNSLSYPWRMREKSQSYLVIRICQIKTRKALLTQR